MNRQEHLLTILAEECAEVAHRASKAARFGMTQVQPDQIYTNKERIAMELDDLFALAEMVGVGCRSPARMKAKREKVEKYLALSKVCGTLTE